MAGGVAVEGEAAKVVQGVPTAGAVPSGARVEREVSFDFSTMTGFRLALRDADFTTAARIEAVINDDLGPGVAELLDAAGVPDVRVAVRPDSAAVVGALRLPPDLLGPPPAPHPVGAARRASRPGARGRPVAAPDAAATRSPVSTSPDDAPAAH